MAAQPVEWVLIVYYGPAAHQATYGRLGGLGYTKDFIQLSKTDEFVEEVAHVLSVPATETGMVPLTFRWPGGSARGDFVFRSADRPHLKWETNQGAPPPWRMAPSPSETTVETIPGNPGHTKVEDAEKEFSKIASRGGGQPYLMAVKLKDEPRTLHLRSYLKDPSEKFAWADLNLVPKEVQALASKAVQSSALNWSLFKGGGVFPSSAVEEAVSRLSASKDRTSVFKSLDFETGRALIDYLRRPGHGLFFDPTKNHDAWSRPAPLPMALAESVDDLLQELEMRFPAIPQGDATAEKLETNPIEVEDFQKQIAQGTYSVADATATTKTRGSAQKAFADAVKKNYGYCCAITGLTTKDFLIASHIVPWSEDQDIRLDPSNGICLSLMVDRAFEKGYLTIDDDLTIRIDESRIGNDQELRKQLQPFHGKALRLPKKQAPLVKYLQRRRTLIASND